MCSEPEVCQRREAMFFKARGNALLADLSRHHGHSPALRFNENNTCEVCAVCPARHLTGRGRSGGDDSFGPSVKDSEGSVAGLRSIDGGWRFADKGRWSTDSTVNSLQ